MKLQLSTLSALASSLTLAVPVDNNAAISCPSQSSPTTVGMCSDPNFSGYGRSFTTCSGVCYDMIDRDVADFRDGISSIALPPGLECKFFAGHGCDINNDWQGTYQSQADLSAWGLDNRVLSWKCAHGTLDVPHIGKRDVADVAVTNVARGCSDTVQIGLCADINFGGYCHDFTQCSGACYDLIDYGILSDFGDGVSSMVFPKGQECKVFPAKECDYNSDWQGTYESQPEMDIWRDGADTVTVNLDNKMISWACAHGTLDVPCISDCGSAEALIESRNVADINHVEETARDTNTIEETTRDLNPIEEIANSTLAIASTNIKTTRVTLCRDTDFDNCITWAFEIGVCQSANTNHNLRGLKSIYLDPVAGQECLLFREDNCQGLAIVVGQSEQNLDYLVNERNQHVDINDKTVSLWCCEGFDNRVACGGQGGSCWCGVEFGDLP